MALWSCIVGYCEALSTHKERNRRYNIYPIPYDALQRLIGTELQDKIIFKAGSNNNSGIISTSSSLSQQPELELDLELLQTQHRTLVQNVSNAVWDTAVNKSKGSTSSRDELHANNVYVCLRGDIDNKSLDCFGSAITTIAAEAGTTTTTIVETKSMLTLSEDHAYERHTITNTAIVAIPGSTKKEKSKRGGDIADTFLGKKNSTILTPESSWLYMSNNPVICETLLMGLVHIIGNINSNINPRKNNHKNRQLYILKRELLWVLYDLNGMEKCPFGYMELGDCEQTELYNDFGLNNDNECLMNEVLLLKAIVISKEIYNDRQVYPYYYLGHYHKDAGKNSSNSSNFSSGRPTGIGNNNDVDDDEPEHQFIYAIRMYVEAIRVTATYYRYDIDDCKQLNKHITTVTQYIYEDILQDRKWKNTSNAILCCYWLFKFIDLLFYYEEYTLLQNDNAGMHTNNQHFVDTLQLKHKFSFIKLIQTFDYESVRQCALNRLLTEQEKYNEQQQQQQQQQQTVDATATTPTSSTTSTSITISPPRPFRSKRMETLVLSRKLMKNNPKIVDMDLVIILDDDTNDNESNNSNGGRSQRKRRRR
ncbi:hypothetical protein FRACYDRAFT_192277 [Fragilariopsis cylindrus CCMP1102]|uniref:Menin n=1 Tax=Fragilariopsis cylindrus CCMP1102 TaxID=635003 RepID=A0A1E7F077_9STRA|nr:hypothetical protein FRACYDRAFT_192277 [Fragilariopsis cylindrus CCMP1102]|eukprot:OEU11527.1 hypothetical protein FRACYDRAFT_192277 [Fragilariopsis cylindrus CCMP1102]